DDPRAFAGLAQDLLHHVVVSLGPVPCRAQLPAVDDVTDQKDRFGVVNAQKVEQPLGLTATRAKMHVRDEEGSEPTPRFGPHNGHTPACIRHWPLPDMLLLQFFEVSPILSPGSTAKIVNHLGRRLGGPPAVAQLEIEVAQIDEDAETLA